MARILVTQKLVLDPNVPITGANLVGDAAFVSAAITTNIIRADGIREVTLAAVHDEGPTAQSTVTVQYFTVGKNIADLTNLVLTEVGTVATVLFVPITIVGDTQIIAVITISGATVDVNAISTQKVLLDFDNLITSTVVTATGPIIGQFLAVTAELSKPHSGVAQGTKEAVLVSISQST